MRIAAIFEEGNLRPVWIDRRGQRIDIKEVTYMWESHLGKELLRHYAFIDAHDNPYELVFNAGTLQWALNPGVR